MRFRSVLLFGLVLGSGLLASCGGRNSDIPRSSPDPSVATVPSTSQADSSAAVSANAERFVFGAVPGKPVVYWIHTDW